ncbi:putative transporter [Vanrija pseudolonga]|uniref:Purtative transporter n=1 Tax=Vanrija pseudolonga TaxID=143232 RepID=A0AAF1BLN8_9TREE|nr:purtative transporter [Vanrija pseudolonga]
MATERPQLDTKESRTSHVEDSKAPATAAPAETGTQDLAATFYADYAGQQRDIGPEENKRVLWKIDRYLMPIICYIYFCQQLDKSTLSFASVYDLKQAANLKGQQYAWLGSIVYFAQLVFQPLSVYALVRFPVDLWISGCFLAWGACLCIMTAMTNFTGLAIMRFFLGGFEASIAPSMLIVVSMWWTRREQPLRNNIWYSTNGLAAILGSLMSWGLGHTKTSLYKYQLIFLVPGIISVALAIPTFWLFPRHPVKARFLTEDDKYVALERIRLNNTGTQNTDFKWSQVRECLVDPKSWMWLLMIFTVSVVSGGITTFGPLILKGFGLSTFDTILYNMIPGGISIVSNITTALIIQHTKYKAPVVFVASLFPLAGAAALFTLPHTTDHKSKLLAVYFILQVYQCITPIVYSWCFANTAGHTKKTTMTGMLYVGLCVGNIVGPQLYKANQAPEYKEGLEANLVCLCALSALIVAQALYLKYLNRRNVNRRRAKGKTGQVLDYSLEASSRWAGLRADQAAKDAAEGHQEEHNAQAFMDLTDLQNEDFIYSL